MYMKKIIIVMLFFVSIFFLFFVYNNDFLYSKEIMKIKNIKVMNEETLENTVGLKEKHYTKKITGIITNGKNKNKKKSLLYEETYSSVITDKYRVGDKVILSGNDIELKRDFYVALLIVIFVNSIYIVGSFKGLLSIISVVLNLIIFYIGLYFYF